MEEILEDTKIIAAFIALGGVVIGGILTFFFTWFKDLKIEKQKQKESEKQFKREKLEELFILLNQYNTNMIKPLIIQKNDIEQERLSMLIRFYFFDLDKEWHDYLLSCSKIIELKINNQDYTNELPELSNKIRLLNKLIVEKVGSL